MICIGAGAHFADIEAIAHRAGIYNITAYDDDPATGIPAPPRCVGGPLLIGVNDPTARRLIAERFPHLRGAAPIVDPSAIIGPDCHLGRGSVVAAQTGLYSRVSLGKHCHVNYHASMTRANLGDFCTVSPGVTICGNVDIGSEVWIGASATICDRVKIGNGVTIAAGALVLPESVVPDGVTVIGIFKP